MNIKCLQLSKPEATVAGTQTPSVTEWRRKPWQKPDSVAQFSSDQRTNSVWLWFRHYRSEVRLDLNIQNIYPVPSGWRFPCLTLDEGLDHSVKLHTHVCVMITVGLCLLILLNVIVSVEALYSPSADPEKVRLTSKPVSKTQTVKYVRHYCIIIFRTTKRNYLDD